jgi:hypothetical protein
MKRYKVHVNIYVDAENEDAADDLVTQMMCGTEMMSRMWDVQDVTLSNNR